MRQYSGLVKHPLTSCDVVRLAEDSVPDAEHSEAEDAERDCCKHTFTSLVCKYKLHHNAYISFLYSKYSRGI